MGVSDLKTVMPKETIFFSKVFKYKNKINKYLIINQIQEKIYKKTLCL